jgi:hypothetical protein
MILITKQQQERMETKLKNWFRKELKKQPSICQNALERKLMLKLQLRYPINKHQSEMYTAMIQYWAEDYYS